MVVTKDYEFFQASRLLTDVYEFICRIILIDMLDLYAVRSAFHYVYLYHIVLFLIFSNLRKILNIYDRCDKNLHFLVAQVLFNSIPLRNLLRASSRDEMYVVMCHNLCSKIH